jgi:hypothetical protein
LFEDAARRVIHDCLSFQSRTGPISGDYRSLAGSFISGNAHGIFIPFAVLLCLAGDCASWRFRAHMPFYQLPAASFFFAGFVQNERTRGAVGRGFWGLAPRSSRAVRSIGPAIAFTHRAEGFTCRCCHGIYFLSQVLVSGLWFPLLEIFRLGL